MHRVTIFALSVLFFICNVVFSQPSPSVVGEPVAFIEALYYNHTSHIARTSDGKLFVVWASSATDGQIVYSQYDPVFQFWSPAAPISTCPSGGTPHKTGIAADESGNLYVAWQQRNTTAEDYAIYFSKYDGSGWSDPVNLTGNDLENEEVSIEVNDQEDVFLIWNTDSESEPSQWVLSIRSSDGGTTWSNPPDTLSSSDGSIGGTSIESARVAMARGSNGKMVCTWFEVPDAGISEEIFANQFDGISWGEEQLVSGITTAASRYPSAAIDAADNIYIVWRPNLPQRSLVLKKKAWNEVSWPAAVDTVVGQGYSTLRPFMTIDENDNLYVAYTRTMENDTIGLDQISYVTSTNGGTTWSDQIRLSRDLHDCDYVCMTTQFDPGGIDLLWREAYRPSIATADTVSLVYGHLDLIPTAIGNKASTVLEAFQLHQNYPNPFNPSTRLSYSVAVTGRYDLSVYNLLGQKIKTLVSENVVQGSHTVTWDGTDDAGRMVASGIYFYELRGEGVHLSKKMVFMR